MWHADLALFMEEVVVDSLMPLVTVVARTCWARLLRRTILCIRFCSNFALSSLCGGGAGAVGDGFADCGFIEREGVAAMAVEVAARVFPAAEALDLITLMHRRRPLP